jgi:hypothetical protein
MTLKLESLRTTPGCYLFVDKGGAVVYVGTLDLGVLAFRRAQPDLVVIDLAA